MSVPQKPWENLQYTQHQNTNTFVGSGRNVLHSHAPQPSPYLPTLTRPVTVSQSASTLPPLPVRPQHLFNRPAFGISAPMYGGYSGYTSGYGGYGASYGGMYGGYGYGSFPMGGGFENRFLQVAEESSRDAFQSIESIVRAFTSVSMMLESTYYAMHSSFRAVLGVADNFSRLRQMFAQFLSTIAVLRIIRNFYRRLLYWLGLLDYTPQAERVWESVNAPAGEAGNQVAGSPKWPLITFIAFLLGGPYLISKFFSSSSPEGNQQWDVSKGHYIRAAYPHQAGTQAELSFQANEVLNIAPQELQGNESSGWLLASNQNGKVGYVPITRLCSSSKANTTTTSDQERSVRTNEAQSAESQ